jgi:hypothetical protein
MNVDEIGKVHEDHVIEALLEMAAHSSRSSSNLQKDPVDDDHIADEEEHVSCVGMAVFADSVHPVHLKRHSETLSCAFHANRILIISGNFP